jgi:hypothetical protein
VKAAYVGLLLGNVLIALGGVYEFGIFFVLMVPMIAAPLVVIGCLVWTPNSPGSRFILALPDRFGWRRISSKWSTRELYGEDS